MSLCNAHSIKAEADLDGVYVIRTSVLAADMSAAECVRGYKPLCSVERALRTLKTTHLRVRPIYHRLSERVQAHLFLCMLAYHVEWYMREAWRPLIFADPELRDSARQRDPVKPVKRSDTALRKAHSATLEDGAVAHSFETLMESL